MAIAQRKSERKTARYSVVARAYSFHPYHNHHKSVCIKRLYIASGRVPRGPQRLLYRLAKALRWGTLYSKVQHRV